MSSEYAERLKQLSPEQRARLLQRAREKLAQQATPKRRADPSEAPLSFGQQRLWLLEQLQPDAPLYNITTILPIQENRFEMAALQARIGECLRQILARHEVLRANIVADEAGQPQQRFRPVAAPPLTFSDLGTLEPAAQREAVRRVAAEEVARPFDLAEDLLLRAHLLRLSDAQLHLVLTIHHIVFDGWSVQLLLREMETIFAALSAGQPPQLPELPLQYADFAAWQRERLQGDNLARLLGYWRERLQAPPTLDLPTTFPRPAVRTAGGAQVAFEIPPPLAQALRQFSRAGGATLYMILLATWGTLLARYSGQTDILIGSPVANRTHEALEPLIGFFVNTLVLRLDLSGQPDFRTLLRRVRERVLEAQEHQELPFELLVEALNLPRDLSRTPLFQTMFALQYAPTREQGGTVNLLSEVDSPAKFDLTLTLVEGDAPLRGTLEYNTSLFDRATVERMVGHFCQLLEGIVAAPDRPITALPLLTPAEREQLLITWNQRTRPIPPAPLHEQVAARAAQQPAAPALIWGEEALAYGALIAASHHLAGHLHQRGIGPGDRVGLLLPRSPALIIGLLAILQSGAAYLPLDPTYPTERLAWMSADAGLALLLSQSGVAAPALPELPRLNMDKTSGDAAPPLPDGLASAESLAYLIYTSGSTGRPKGVMVDHRALSNLVQAQIEGFGLEPSQRVLQLASTSFDASVSEIFTTLVAGATLVLPPPVAEGAGLDVLALLQRHEISTATLPPSLLSVLPPDELPALRTVIAAGERCPGEVVRRWAGGRRFLNAYGPTEATVCVTMMPCDPTLAGEPPIGRPIDNVRVYLLDAHHQPVPIGVPGELFVGGAGVALGYHQRPALTADRFRPDPFGEPGARLYATGDLARWRPDGTLDYLGRRDEQVKVRGFRVELGEVEAALAAHPTVQQAAVVAQADPVAGQRLVAFVLPTAPAPALDQTLHQHLQGRLPAFMLPWAIELVSALPLTPNGKIDRRALAAQPSAPRATHFVAPETGAEATIAQIWRSVLQVEQVGRQDNFFDLGGTSLAIAKVHHQLREAGLSVTMVDLFQYPTVQALAEFLAQGQQLPEAVQGTVAAAQRRRQALQRQRRR